MEGRPDGGMREEEDLLGPDLRALLSTLPKELAPETDLTASIAARTWDSREKLPGASNIDAVATDIRSRSAPWWSGQGLKLAAAAVALIVITSAVTTAIISDAATPSDAPATVAGASMDGAPTATDLLFAGYADVENQYAAAIADLADALESDRDRLPPETVQLIEENLRIIDEAIQHSLAALASTPESLPLQQAVMTSYERKLDFLRQAAALTAEG
jgi:hypothetical protein